ncbi:lipid II flippase MurJ [Pseudonocardia acidicola]|uniref:Peptidoglycan lipid II flippase n=1 Tax=Pseudonocardia acidicola TaxID=2724939 RepID=A0ABX1SFE5_9PSEU|nr:lipid II flippase MurJ [Pseudonocardia acidicola]NMI00271.1 hypothetical protein [Pseudonocardia acidicola]
MSESATVMNETPRDPARSSVTVAGWTLVSRVTGLLRVLVIGAVLGPTYFANSFQSGYVVPNLVYTVIAGPVLAMVVVPTVVRVAAVHGTGHAARTLARVGGVLLAISAVVAVVLALLSPAVAWTLTVGIPDPAVRERAFRLTVVLVLFVAPQIVLYTVAALGVAALQARQRFALAAAAPAVENLGLIVTVLLAGAVYGAGLEAGAVPMDMIVLLGVGSTLSVVAHAGIQLFGAARLGMVARPTLDWRRDPDAVDVVRRIVRSMWVAACPTSAMYALLALATTVRGGVLVVQLSYSVFYALSYLGGRAVSMAALPGLAAAARLPDRGPFAAAWRTGLLYALLAGLPGLILLAAFAWPTADLLANGELRNAVLISQLAACLTVVAFAQLVGGLHDLGQQALFARLTDRGPRLAAGAALAVTLATAGAALLLPAAGPRLVGLVGALLAGELAAAVIVLGRIRAALRPHAVVEPHQLGRVALAGASMLPVVALGWWALAAAQPGRLGILALLSACGAVALAVYVGVVRYTGRHLVRGAA